MNSKNIKVKNRHVLIASPGPNLKKYWDKIEKFINENQLVTVGGNHVNNIFAPDYNFWGSDRRWNKYGKFVNKKTIFIFHPSQSKKIVRKHWGGSYETYETKKRPGKQYKKVDDIYKCFKSVIMVAIFWAYTNGAKKISIAGMDGYTFYNKKDLQQKKISQHCYGEGLTDGYSYEFSRLQDVRTYENLKMLYKYGKKEYGFGFDILTPTVHKRFYDPTILNIKESYRGKEPTLKEKKEIGSWQKNKKLLWTKY